MIQTYFLKDPGTKLLEQSGLLNTSVGSFLELQLFLIMEPNARKYIKSKVQRILLTMSLKNKTPGYLRKQISNVNVKNVTQKNDIYVINI